MKRTDFLAALEGQGWRKVNFTAYGVRNGFPVTAGMQAGHAKACPVTITLQEEPDKDTRKALSQEIKAVAAKPAFNGRVCAVTLKLDETQPFPLTALDDVLRVLQSRGMTPPCQCGLCNQMGFDAYAMVKGRYDTVHHGCMDSLQGEVVAKAQQMPGSYWTGILGAVLGCIVGVIPNVLTIWFSETIYSLLYALIPLCTYYGYKLCRGKMNKLAVAATLVLSVLSVFIIEFVLLNLTLMEEYEVGLGLSLALTFPLLADGETWGLMAQDAVSSFLFIALGVFIVWGQISRTHASELKDMAKIRQTVLLKQGEGVAIPQAEGPFFDAPLS